MVCPTAIVDAQIALELNQIAYASEVVRRIVTLPQWVNTGEDLRNAFALLNTRINMKMQPTTRCPELNGKKLEVGPPRSDIIKFVFRTSSGWG